MKNSCMRSVWLGICVGLMIPFQIVQSQDRSQGRSMVISRNGIVAAESPLAARRAWESWNIAETLWMRPLRLTQ